MTRILLLPFLLAGMLWTVAVAAAKPVVTAPERMSFARFSENEEVAKLDTVVVRYKDKKGATVDLIGVIHIGDAGYYDALNERFKGYDALLYEMIGGKADDEKAASKKDTLRFFYILYQQMLDLEFQMNGIDYSPGNFVHADMNWAQFQRRMKKKDENLFSSVAKAFEHQEQVRAEGKGDGLVDLQKMMEAIYNGGSAEEIKLEFARQFANMETLMTAMDKGKGGSVIIAERNKVALKVLAREIKKGKKKLALFYGAAHLPGMDERLREKMGFEKVSEEWLTAWDIDKKAIAAAGEEKKPARKKGKKEEKIEIRKAVPVGEDEKEKKKAA